MGRRKIGAGLLAAGLLAFAVTGWVAQENLRAETSGKEAAAPLPRAEAERIFALIKAREGEWHGRSTKGWESRSTYRIIGRDSAVLATSRFLGIPNQGMATVFHMDGDRLLLTHYCEAGNQPRLVASAVSADGRTVTFTFLDGANLPSRDRGHMDKVVMRFLGDDRFTSQWTWYQDGRERWLEEIEYSRVRE